jgi:hypothetical protein
MFSISDIASAASSGMSRTSTGTSLKAGDLRRAPAPLAGNDFETAIADGPHRDGLDQALGLDRCRQLFQRTGVHARARLVLAGLQRAHGKRILALRFGRIVGRQQGVQATAEAFLFGWVHVVSFHELTRSIISTAKAM